MIWGIVAERVIATIVADPTLGAIVGARVRMAGTGARQIPEIQWRLTSDVEGELWAPQTLAFEVWTNDARDNRRAEAALRDLFHQDRPIDIDGLRFSTVYTGGAVLASPDRAGAFGRSLTFRLTPLRARYAFPDTPAEPLFDLDAITYEPDEPRDLMWERVMKRVVAVLLADPVLATIYGGHVRMAGTGEQQVPGLEWSLIGDTENELYAPMVVQFDQWTRDAEAVRASEFRLRALWHRELPVSIGGDLRMFSTYSDGSELATPDRSGFHGRASRFTFTPLRRQYAFPVAFVPEPVVESTGVLWGSSLFGEELFGVTLFN